MENRHAFRSVLKDEHRGISERAGAFSEEGRAVGEVPAWVQDENDDSDEIFDDIHSDSSFEDESLGSDNDPERGNRDSTEDAEERRNGTIIAMLVFLFLAMIIFIALAAVFREEFGTSTDQEGGKKPQNEERMFENWQDLFEACDSVNTVDRDRFTDESWFRMEQIHFNLSQTKEVQNDPGILRQFSFSTGFSCDESSIAIAAMAIEPGVSDFSIDRYLLTIFYTAACGRLWEKQNKWLSKSPICDWYGISCASGGQVTSLMADTFRRKDNSSNIFGSRSSMHPTIPPQIFSLTSLEVFEIWDGLGALRGELSAGFGSLTNLRELIIDGNEIHGTLPTQLGQLSSLTKLQIQSFLVSGTLPTEIFMRQLTNLSIISPILHGTLPSEVGLMQDIRDIYLNNHRLIGEVPPEIWKLPKLQNLNIQGGSLLTFDFDFTVNHNWVAIDLQFVKVASIPTEVGLLENLTSLVVSAGNMKGTLPSEIGNCAVMKKLQIDHNQIAGPIPSEIGNLKQLRHLDLGFNQWTGTLPSEIAELSLLESLMIPTCPSTAVENEQSSSMDPPIPNGLCQLGLKEFIVDCGILHRQCDPCCSCGGGGEMGCLLP